MKSKTPILLAAVALLGIVLGGYVLLKKYVAVQPQATDMTPYSSEDGVSFMYPNTYKLSSAHHTVGEFSWDSVELIDKNYVAPEQGEGPTSISMSVFSNAEGLPLEEFIKNEPRSNYQFSKDGTFTKGTVGGKPSLAYQYSGLYEFDAVAVEHNGKIFIFSDSWMQTIDPIRHDFNTVLATVKFQ